MHNAMKMIKMNATIAVCTPSAHVHRCVFYNDRRVHRTRLPQKHYSAWRPIEQLSVSIISFDSRGFVDSKESIGFPRYTRCRCFLENSPARPCTRSRLRKPGNKISIDFNSRRSRSTNCFSVNRDVRELYGTRAMRSYLYVSLYCDTTKKKRKE